MFPNPAANLRIRPAGGVGNLDRGSYRHRAGRPTPGRHNPTRFPTTRRLVARPSRRRPRTLEWTREDLATVPDSISRSHVEFVDLAGAHV